MAQIAQWDPEKPVITNEMTFNQKPLYLSNLQW